jgi:hypothetical protein
MRRYLALAVAAIVSALVFTSVAQADPIQSITAKLTPTKRDKKKFKPAKIYVEIITQDNEGERQPPSAFNTKVNFPKNAKFDQGAVPRCKASEAQLQGTSTETAINLCGQKSVVSKGSTLPTSPDSQGGTSAWVVIDTGPVTDPLQVPVRVTAFNGTTKDTLYLHSRAETLGVTSVLVGKLKTGKKAPKGYGSQLDVTIPPLALGAIRRFTTTVKAGKYVQARCKTKNEKWQAITAYDDHVTTTDDYKTKCKPKKGKKK